MSPKMPAPKLTFSYLEPSCKMPGYSKKMCSSKNKSSMKLKHSRPKFGKPLMEMTNCDIVKMIEEFNKNDCILGKNEEELKCSTYRLMKCMAHSKELI